MTHKSFVGMNMASKNHINPSLIQQLLHGFPHALSFPLMGQISIIPWRMNEHNKPRRPPPINLTQIPLQPLVLSRFLIELSIRTQHDNMAPSNLKRVVEVGGGATLLERHRPPRIKGFEAIGVDDGEDLNLMVAFSDHPGAVAGVRLHKAAEAVPKGLMAIGIREITG